MVRSRESTRSSSYGSGRPNLQLQCRYQLQQQTPLLLRRIQQSAKKGKMQQQLLPNLISGGGFLTFPNSMIVTRFAVLALILLCHIAESKVSKNTDLRSFPKFTRTQLQNFTVRVGNTVTFACSVENLGEYKVAWLHSDKGTLAVHPHVITHNDRISVNDDSRHTYLLLLKDIKESDAGKYICQINTGPAISIGGALNVVVPPDITDDLSSSDTLATEGMRVVLNCHAEGNPTPAIAWMREDGKQIRICKSSGGGSGSGVAKKKKQHRQLGSSSTSHHHKRKQASSTRCKGVEVHYGPELELSQISRFDSGVYLCIARNGVPPSVSKRVRLYVDFPPTLWISHQLIGADVGSSAQLECLTAAHPPSLNFWSRDGKTYITPKEGKYKFEEIVGEPSFYNNLMKLKIFNITSSDFGTYSCLAKNSQGETSGEISLYEAPRPSTTTAVYIDNDDIWSEPGVTYGSSNRTKFILLDKSETGIRTHGDGAVDMDDSDKRGGGGRRGNKHNNNNNKRHRRKNKKDRKHHNKNTNVNDMLLSSTSKVMLHCQIQLAAVLAISLEIFFTIPL